MAKWYEDDAEVYAVRQYKNRPEMQREIRLAAELGWDVVSTDTFTRRPLMAMRNLIPILWVFGTTGYSVTFRREKKAATR